MRLLAIRVGLIEPQHRTQLQAAADETPSVGKWFSANLNLSTALGLAGTLVSLVGAYYTLQSTNARQDAEIGGNKAAIAKLNEKVVPREEYQNRNRDVDSKLTALQSQIQQQQQQQLYTVLLGRAVAASAGR